MKNYGTLTSLCIFLWFSLISVFPIYAGNDPLTEIVSNFTAKPNITESRLQNGSTVKEVSIPGSTNIVWSISQPWVQTPVTYTKTTLDSGRSVYNFTDGTQATCEIGVWCVGNASSLAESIQSGKTISDVFVTERVPWAKCTCAAKGGGEGEECTSNIKVENRKYKCSVEKWLTAFQEMFRSITRWVVYVTMLLWVFAIAWAGIMWAFGSDSEEYTKKAKWWVMNIVIGLIILFTFRYILWFLAPWIFQ